MAPINSNPKPSFFWRGVLILLPVAGLACFGLYSLRQDRLLAQQEAREAGEVLAQRLAQAISTEAVRQLTDYREASFALHANRTAELGQSAWANGSQGESNAWQRISAWRLANPDIDLAALPPSDGRLTLSPEPMLPQPPEWLGQLNPEQQQLWQAARESVFAAKDFPEAQSAIQAFVASNPPDGARANADYLLLLARTRGLAPADAAAQFSVSRWSQSRELTDAGLPLAQLIWYQWLHLIPNGAGLPKAEYVNSIAWAISYRPSFFSARVVAELERVTKRTDSEAAAATVKAWWEAEEKAWMVREAFREQHPANTWTAAPFWVDSPAGRFLLILGDRGQSSTNASPPSETSYVYLMFPQAVVEKALAAAMVKSDISLPAYALTVLYLGGREISLSHNETAGARNESLPVLGEAGGTWKRLPFDGLTLESSPAYPFRVQVWLARPDILYARQSQRTWMFGALIVASALAAVIGLFAAWRSFRRQQELNELKSNFVSSVSHELRAPIASVRLMAENLERGKIKDAPRQGEYFRFIVQECRRLSSLIENVLDFSRIEQGRKQYEFEPTDLLALTQTTVKLMEPGAAEKGVRLEFHSALRSPNSEFDLDGRAIQQALVNLIDNAIKHSPKGETVTVGLECGGRSAECGTGSAEGGVRPALISQPSTINLFVADHGPGIPREEQDRIFERFYRLGSELRRETQGVGIGLSIVKHIVAAHRGRVWVQSEPGRGSRFVIELPAKTPTPEKPT